MAVQITLAGKVVAKSRNLRGILDHARKSFVRKVSCGRNSDGTGYVYIGFDDGAECRSDFASYSVLLGWVRARRSWDLRECYCSPDMTQFFIPCGDGRY